MDLHMKGKTAVITGGVQGIGFEVAKELALAGVNLVLADVNAEAGGAAPAVLNAANEVAVAAFLDGKVPFTRIAVVVEQVLSRYAPPPPAELADVLAVDARARSEARTILELVTQ